MAWIALILGGLMVWDAISIDQPSPAKSPRLLMAQLVGGVATVIAALVLQAWRS